MADSPERLTHVLSHSPVLSLAARTRDNADIVIDSATDSEFDESEESRCCSHPATEYLHYHDDSPLRPWRKHCVRVPSG